MRYGAAAIARGASVHNRRKCVLTGYGRKKVKDKFRCLRLCSRATALCEECAMCERSCGCSFRPTRAVGVQELMLVHSAGSTAKKWCGRWPRILRKLPSGACGGQFNGTLSTLGDEAQRDAGSTGEFAGHTQAPPREGDLVLRNADRGCTCSKTFRSGACGGQFSIGQAAEWHDVTRDSFG